jgi:hypothetical protein
MPVEKPEEHEEPTRVDTRGWDEQKLLNWAIGGCVCVCVFACSSVMLACVHVCERLAHWNLPFYSTCRAQRSPELEGRCSESEVGAAGAGN